MIRNRKRLWALLLSAALIVTQLPAVAMAETGQERGSTGSFGLWDSGEVKGSVSGNNSGDSSEKGSVSGNSSVRGVSDGEPGKTITGWMFVATAYSDYSGNGLALPGVSMDNQADFDTVVSMLPTQLSAAIEGETEPAPLDITGWSCPEYIQDGDGNWPFTGDYIFAAALPEGYACEPLPTVKVLLGGGTPLMPITP